MEFTIDRDVFSKALSRVQGIVEKKSTMAVLSNVLIRSIDSHAIEIAATDLDVTLVAKCPASVDEPGAISLEARDLHQLVRSLPPGEIAVTSIENNWARISHGTIEFRFAGISAKEFPNIPEAEDMPGFDVERKAFLDAVEGVIFSVSTEDTRPNLNGVMVRTMEDGRTMMVSTDGHRLSKLVRDLGMKHGVLPADGVIIPRKGLTELKRALDETAKTIFMGFEGSHVMFRTESEFLVVRLIEGVFPDFERVIPKTSRNVVTVDRASFQASLKRVSLFAQSNTNGIHITLLPEGIMRISTSNPDRGEAKEDIPIEYQGDKVEVGYNARYVLDCLNVLRDREVRFEMNDDISPGILRTEAEPDSFYVIMPMRI